MYKIINNKFIILLILINIFFISIFIEGNTNSLRCTHIGIKIFDDLLGMSGVEKECKVEFPQNFGIEKIVTQNKNVLLDKELRFGIKKKDLQKKSEVNCPKNSDVIIILGQSNAANNVLSNITKSNKDVNFFDSKCYKVTEPILGATANKQSITSSLSSKIKNDKPIIFINNSVSGSSILDWSTNEIGFSKYVNKNLQYILKENNLKYIIWMQGESDSSNYKINYIEHFEIMKNKILKNINPEKIMNYKFIVTPTSICGFNQKSNSNLIEQQKKLNAKFSNVIVVKTLDTLDNNYRYDGCHLNNFGVEEITNEFSKIINRNY